LLGAVVVVVGGVVAAGLPAGAQAQATCGGLVVTVDLGAGQVPTSGPDVILGTAGPDVISGLGGADVICGLGGDDTIFGGPGDDTIFGGDGNDTIFGGDGNDTIFGEGGGDTIQGNAGNDTIDGGAGDDVLSGNDGDDQVAGGIGDDTIYGGAGADTIDGGGGADTILGGLGNDVIDGGAGHDLISGNDGNDTIDGGDGNDTIFGVDGNDTLSGGPGNDIVLGGNGSDIITGGDGDDLLSGNDGADVVDGGAGNDEVYGAAGNDDLTGGPGLDIILGGPGDDTIDAADGEADQVSGNAGVDTCIIDVGIDAAFQCEFVSGPPGAVRNGSFESGGIDAADGWFSDSWGTISATFAIPATGGHSGSRFARVDVSARTSGDAKWYFEPVAVTPGTTYRFTDWYRSDAASELTVAWSTSSGVVYQWLGDLAPASAWTRAIATAVAPTGAHSATVFHLLATTGRLDIDDVAFGEESTTPGGTPLVSLTFDDGWESHASVAAPALQTYGYRGTFYITTGFLDNGPYVSSAQMIGLHDAGHEIGAHTVSHPDLTGLPAAAALAELQESRATLEALIGRPVDNFATPFGAFNGAVLGQIMSVFGSHRTVFEGLNRYGLTDRSQLRVRNVLNTTTATEVDGWLAEAQAQGAWLILVYHRIVAAPTTYDTTPEDLAAHLASISSRGFEVVTVAQGLQAVGAG
jgi:peptidoglycan/xylan/chitin deacetylase (PgdA/CDA1 family)